MIRWQRQRIALEGDAARLVEELAAERGVTVPEVVRQALLRERWYRRHEMAGDKIMVQTPDKKMKEVHFVQGSQGI
jgi:Ribbon-helix-helix protein, copG family